MSMKNLSLDEFTALTASSSPSPGGGSIAALTGAVAASLSSMVAALTVDKNGYEQSREEMQKMIAECEELRAKLLDDIDRDCTSFDGYIAALKLPKDTDEQKESRRAEMQKALKHAAEVPLSIAKTAIKVMPLAEAAVERGNKNAVTDGVISAMLCRTAVFAALYNVKINLGMIKDNEYLDRVSAEVRYLEWAANEAEQRIVAISGF